MFSVVWLCKGRHYIAIPTENGILSSTFFPINAGSLKLPFQKEYKLVSNNVVLGPDVQSLLLEQDLRGVVFDLDGTLLDSATDIMDGMRLTFEHSGYGVLAPDYVSDNLHGTCENIMQHIINDMGWQQPTEFDSLKEQYFRYYASLNYRNTQLYPGALAVLQACAQAGLAIGVCTNKSYASALSVSQLLHIDTYFNTISGSDSWGQAKPSPVPLLETIRSLGVQPEQCLYFGDTSVDALCASRADVRFVLHTAGYGDVGLRDSSWYAAFEQWNQLALPSPLAAQA